MDGLIVILDKKDITVRMDGKAMRVDKPDGSLERFPLGMIGQVIVYGRPMVACDVWLALAEKNIPVILFSGRGRQEPAWVGTGLSTAGRIRVLQHQAFHHSDLVTQTARWLLYNKLTGQIAVIGLLSDKKYATDFPIQSFESAQQAAQKVIQQITTTRESVLTASIDQIMGLEGSAAASYFGFFSTILLKSWEFSGRNRRPPKDPVNALLSLTYTMVLSEVRRVIQMRGLDPCLGAMHVLTPGRESLALDLLEPFRAAADIFVLGLIKKSLSREMFSLSSSSGCRLNSEGRRHYYQAWALARDAWPMPAEVIPFGVFNEIDEKIVLPAMNVSIDSKNSLKYCIQLLVESLMKMWEMK
ncbi:CRISPR-associated endonuclease Cas1 [Magnetococcales bacterium HHB-1]